MLLLDMGGGDTGSSVLIGTHSALTRLLSGKIAFIVNRRTSLVKPGLSG